MISADHESKITKAPRRSIGANGEASLNFFRVDANDSRGILFIYGEETVSPLRNQMLDLAINSEDDCYFEISVFYSSRQTMGAFRVV